MRSLRRWLDLQLVRFKKLMRTMVIKLLKLLTKILKISSKYLVSNKKETSHGPQPQDYPPPAKPMRGSKTGDTVNVKIFILSSLTFPGLKTWSTCKNIKCLLKIKKSIIFRCFLLVTDLNKRTSVRKYILPTPYLTTTQTCSMILKTPRII